MGKTIGKRKKNIMKARSVKYDEIETEKIVLGKLRDKIQIQADYVQLRLQRMVKESKLKCMSKELKKAEEKSEEILEWLGVKYYYDVLATEYNLEIFFYKRLLTDEKGKRTDLIKKYGMKEKEVLELDKGNYMKVEEELVKSEKKLEEMNKKDAKNYIG